MLHHLKTCKHVIQDVRYKAAEENSKKGSDEEGEFELIPVAGPSSGSGFSHGSIPPFYGTVHAPMAPPAGLQRSSSLPVAGPLGRFRAISADSPPGESYQLYMHMDYREKLLSRLYYLSRSHWAAPAPKYCAYSLWITIP